MTDGLHRTISRSQVNTDGQNDARLHKSPTFDLRCRHPRHAAFVCVLFVDFDLTTPHPACGESIGEVDMLNSEECRLGVGVW